MTAPVKDIKGFCNSANIEQVRQLDYVLTPGRLQDLLMKKMILILRNDLLSLR